MTSKKIGIDLFDKRMIQEGDLLTIHGTPYEVLMTSPDAMPAPERKDFPARMYFRIDLHDGKQTSLFPTHELDYYWEDTKELLLVDLIHKKTETILPYELYRDVERQKQATCEQTYKTPHSHNKYYLAHEPNTSIIS